ncbi:MAG: YdcF family protein [Sulfurifustaceae bacterium]
MLVIAKAIGTLLTPPTVLVVLAMVGLLVQRRSRWGASLAWAGLLSLLLLSVPFTAHVLIGTLQDRVPPLVTNETLRAHADAIVVLGGGRIRNAPEYGTDTVNDFTLERLRYAVRLHRASGLPLLMSGGSPFGEPVSEAELMQRSLSEDFNVRANWIEGHSRNTYENATYTRAILEAGGMRRIVLVTHAWHMPRALHAFQRVGLDVIPAPTGYITFRRSVLSFLPSSSGLSESSRAINEWIGIFWYALRYGTGFPHSCPDSGTLQCVSRIAASTGN